MKHINAKLLLVSSEIEAIAKDSKNPHFKSKYFDINKLLKEVKPVLINHGLLLTQPLKDGRVYSIITDPDSQEFVESWIDMIPEANPQRIGSQISYFRRYTLGSLLSVEAEDDDANLASKPTPPQAPAPKPLTKPQYVKAMASGIEGITATLNAKSITMNDEQRDNLEAQRNLLQTQQEA